MHRAKGVQKCNISVSGVEIASIRSQLYNMGNPTIFYILSLLLLLSGCHLCSSAKILSIFPFQSRSHTILGVALSKELAKRGHEVTMISHFPEKNPVANYTDIYVKTTLEDFNSNFGKPSQHFGNTSPGVIGKIKMAYKFIFQVNQEYCDLQLQEEAVQKLIHATDVHYDLVIMEAFFNECFLGFVHKFKAPLIHFCTFGGTHWMGDWVGNPNPYAYVPDQFLNTDDHMNFKERLINTVVGTVWRLARKYLYLPKQDASMRKHFGFLEDLPYISDIEYSTALLMANHHFSISYPRPLMPNFIQVGGLQIQTPKKLPQDLQKYLDESKNGVIYFSMGSNLQSSAMPDSTKNELLKAFSELEQNVIWKWETDVLPGQPKNVNLGKWFPQTDILAHPNVKVFITHGGLLSTQEALHRSIPIVGIPVFGDQVTNTLRAQKAGYGIMLEFTNITAESVKWAIKEVLDNPSYRENAQRISKIFREQPLTPLDTAVYWTEYVIRHKGAPHMRSAALDLAWYQYFLLDVIAVLTLALCSVLLVTFLILRVLFRKCCGKRTVDKSKKHN